jgi:hypothetical protein
MGLSMRLTAPNGETYYVTCRDGRTIDVERSAPVHTMTVSPNEWATTAAPRTFDYMTSDVLRALDEGLFPEGEEGETSCL